MAASQQHVGGRQQTFSDNLWTFNSIILQKVNKVVPDTFWAISD